MRAAGATQGEEGSARSVGWVVIRRRVTLGGRVRSANGKLATGGVLALAASERRYTARIRTDGYYCFLDVPAGDYMLSGRLGNGQAIDAKSVSIPEPGGSVKLPMLGHDLVAAEHVPREAVKLR